METKRTAWVAARILLRASGIHVRATAQDVVDFMLRLAAKEVGVDEISTFLLQQAVSDSAETASP